MEHKPYIFLGFHLGKICLDKQQQEDLKEIRISIPNYDYDKENTMLSLEIRIEVDFDKSKENVFLYIAGFKILDHALRKEMQSKEKVSGHIPLLMRFVIPFIRENLISISKDIGDMIVLPMIDCQDITLDTTLILTRE